MVSFLERKAVLTGKACGRGIGPASHGSCPRADVPCLAAHWRLTLCNPMDCSLPGSSVHGDSPGKNTGVGCHALLQRVFPTQRLNLGLPHCRRILYHLSHQGSPRIPEWVAYPFSSGSSQPKNWIRVSCIAGGFFTSWATRETCSPPHPPSRSFSKLNGRN